MKKILFCLFGSVLLMPASPALANQEFDKALSIVKSAPMEASQANYRLLKNTISSQKAKGIEMDITKAFGQPKKSRGDLKVWEIPMAERTFDQAKYMTIMFEQLGKNEFYISLDARGAGIGNNPRLNNQSVKLQPKKAKKAKKVKKTKPSKANSSDF